MNSQTKTTDTRVKDANAEDANIKAASAGQAGYRFSIRIMAVVFLCYFFTSYRISENPQTVGIVALFSILVANRKWAFSLWPWVIVLATLLFTLAERTLDMPNHHFMMIYLSLTIILVSTVKEQLQAKLLQQNVRWILLVLMAFATVQKAAQPTYRDGSYLGYELIQGGFGGPLLRFLGEPGQKMKDNQAKILEFRQQDPTTTPSVQLELPTENLLVFSYGFAISILAIEAWFVIAMWFFPTALLTHLSILSFIIVLGALRQEFTFISVVAVMGLMLTDASRTYLRLSYATLALLTAAAVLKTLN